MGSTAKALQRLGDSDWIERLGRIGLVAKGVSFGLVGVLAVLVALGVGGAATDRAGALRLLFQGMIQHDHPRRARAQVPGVRRMAARAGAPRPRQRGQRLEGSGRRRASRAKGLSTRGWAVLASSSSQARAARAATSRSRRRACSTSRSAAGSCLRSAVGLIGYGLERLWLDHRQGPQAPRHRSDGEGGHGAGSVNAAASSVTPRGMVLFVIVGFSWSGRRGSATRRRRSASTRRSPSWRTSRTGRCRSAPRPSGSSPTASSASSRPVPRRSRPRRVRRARPRRRSRRCRSGTRPARCGRAMT